MTSPRRILGLFVGAAGVGGGIAQVAVDVLDIFADEQVETRALSLLGTTRDARDHGWFGCISYSAFQGRRPRFSAAALLAAARHQPDVVYCDLLNLAPVAWACAKIARARLALFVHSAELWSPQPGQWLLGDRRSWLSRMDSVLVNSATTGERVRSVLGDRQADVHVCHLAPRRLESSGTARPAADPTALMVGRMASQERYKGHDETVRAWAHVRQAIPGARLRVVGDGDDRRRLERLAATLGHRESIDFLGSVSDAELADEYAAADVLVLPSTGEGYGLVYGEAGLLGVPSIAHHDGPARELIVDGTTGWLVDGQDARTIAGALIDALGDREATRARGRAARDRFDREFSRARFRSRLLVGLGLDQPSEPAACSGSEA